MVERSIGVFQNGGLSANAAREVVNEVAWHDTLARGNGEPVRPAGESAAGALAPLINGLLGDPPPLRIEFWDGTALGGNESHDGPVIRVKSPDAIRRMVWSPGELGAARAYIAGDIDIEGDIFEAVRRLRPAGTALRRSLKTAVAGIPTAVSAGLIGRPPPHPPEEANPRGRRHSKRRDAQAISHHYDVGNEFYQLVLGPAMTYSCARFARDGMSLVEAQASKHDLICRKLGLHERAGMRLLDVGCGWGSMAIHAARHYRARVVGITISKEQAALARARVAEAGMAHLVEIRLQDYRDLGKERFDAISSIGMFEHVGRERAGEYFSILRSLLEPRGRLLNHAISSVGGSRLPRRSFVYRYVFPDGELIDAGDVFCAMEEAGFEVRDVESLREHYARTLRAWVSNLERHWDEAVGMVGAHRARIWRLYMVGSAIGFEDGGLGLHQVLGVATDSEGRSGMPATRDGWSTDWPDDPVPSDDGDRSHPLDRQEALVAAGNRQPTTSRATVSHSSVDNRSDSTSTRSSSP